MEFVIISIISLWLSIVVSVVIVIVTGSDLHMMLNYRNGDGPEAG